jgi:hypothetical protein
LSAAAAAVLVTGLVQQVQQDQVAAVVFTQRPQCRFLEL